MARRNEWPLDKMCLQCDVTKKTKDEMGQAPREGAYVHGLFLEGARWDIQSSMLAEARLKELTPLMPVIFIKVQFNSVQYYLIYIAHVVSRGGTSLRRRHSLVGVDVCLCVCVCMSASISPELRI